jgi:hypothetical protein
VRFRSSKVCLRIGSIELATAAVFTRQMRTAFRALEGNHLQRRCDPRLFGLPINPVSVAVILYVVAVHGKLPMTVNLELRPAIRYS